MTSSSWRRLIEPRLDAPFPLWMIFPVVFAALYACHFTLEQGAGSAVGSIGVAPGQSRVVSDKTYNSKITGVRESSLDCE